jgi:hypothetical protein
LEKGNENGDKINFLNFIIDGKGEVDCCHFIDHPIRVNIMLDTARGKTDGFSENDMGEVAELIKHGFISNTGDGLRLKLPVYTNEQYTCLLGHLDDVITDFDKKNSGELRMDENVG